MNDSTNLRLSALFALSALACSSTHVGDLPGDSGGAAASGSPNGGAAGGMASNAGAGGGGGSGASGGSGVGGSGSSGGRAGSGGAETCLTCSGGKQGGGGIPGSGGQGAGGTGGLGGSGGALGDAGPPVRVKCNGGGPLSFPRFNVACLRAEDCVLVHRQTDCCGSLTNMAINSGEAAAFAAAEAVCEAQFPLCDCAARPAPVATAVCVESRCEVSGSGGGSFACGTYECSRGQYCSTKTPGTGGVTSYGCVNDPYCASDCIYCNLPSSCQCLAPGGHVQVLCQGV